MLKCETFPVIHERLDGGQTVGRIDHTVGLDQATPEADPASDQGLAAGNAIVVKHGGEQEGGGFILFLIFVSVPLRECPDRVLDLMLVG